MPPHTNPAADVDESFGTDLPTAGQALLASLIDYAGLFPPAALALPAAVRAYADALASDRAWMLGRFILPVSRLAEFSQTAAGLLPTHAPAENSMPAPSEQPWPISALIDGDHEPALESILAFNARHDDPRAGLAVIDSVEIKVPPGVDSAAFIDGLLDGMPDELYPFFEMPADADPRGFAAALAGSDAGAKVRTGGVIPGAFPSPGSVAAFLAACDAADVPFKATAGLHHALRGEQPLTYEPNCQRAVMHGFLNVFVAACAVRSARTVRNAPAPERILAETDATAFRFVPDRIEWRGFLMPVELVLETREEFARSYGSCSFDEPTSEAMRLGVV